MKASLKEITADVVFSSGRESISNLCGLLSNGPESTCGVSLLLPNGLYSIHTCCCAPSSVRLSICDLGWVLRS